MSDLVITGIIDGPITGGVPKAVEFFALDDIPDLSVYGFGSANNGGGSDGQEYTFSGTASAGDYIYIATETIGFNSFLGFNPDDTSSASSINGDDAIELFLNGAVVDTFGEINIDGTGEPWEYLDGWAYRVPNTSPDGTTFNISNWTFSSPNALDGETSNGSATTPFPLGSFSSSVETPSFVINELYVSHTGTDDTEFIEIFGTPGTSLDGLSFIGVEGDSGSPIGTIDDRIDFDSTHTIGDNGFFLVGNPIGLTNNYAVAPNVEISNNFLENGSSTFALVETSSISGTSVTGSEVVIDTVALTDGGAGDTFFFDAPVVGLDSPFFPAGARRVTDGVDTDTVSDFVISDFFLGVDNTPTAGTTDNGGGEATLTPIHEIQGSSTSSLLESQTVTIEAVVVGDYQDGASGTNGDLNGFFVQEEDADADADPLTSEGIFIFDGDSPAVDVKIGDVVQVTGTVTESNGLTELTNVTVSIQGTDTLPTPATVNFPVTTVEDLEAFEGMGITIPDTLFVTGSFNLERFGEIVLASDGESNEPGTDGRLEQFTDFNAPDLAGFAAYQEAIATRRIILDDAQTVENPNPIIHGRGGNPLSSTNTLRGGDTVDNLSGILSFGSGEYRIQPVNFVDFQATNLRPETPDDVGGNLKVASLNVLNFFTTLDEAGNPGSGPNGLSPRGADNQAEFDRQVEKLVTILEDIDADIFGLVELENEFGGDQNGDGQFAIQTLVDEINNRVGAGTYAYVDPGVPFVDTGDAISVGAIYKTDSVKVAPGTTVEILTDSDLPALGLGGTVFDGNDTNRAPLAVTFEELATGERFTVSVNHFKSKGGTGTGDDADVGDGQGNFNGTRLRASEALNAWLNTDPTGSGDEDFLIVGDLNAYAQEDPITFLEAEGYTDLAQQFVGNSAYSFTFDGQLGTIDYALANSSLTNQVTGATEWHVNVDEPDALDYNLDFGRDPSLFNGQDQFRNSDHDPIIVGLNLESPNDAPVLDKTLDTKGATADIELTVEEDTTADGEVGNKVSEIVSLGGNVTDADTGAVTGIAITATDQSNGTWHYSTDGGTTWSPVGEVSKNSALLLAADANTRLLFTPNENYNGTITNGITFRAWDQTSGTAGNKEDVTSNGNDTAFSSETDTANIIVTAKNDAPTAADKTITIEEDNNHIFSQTDFSFNDIDGDSLASITITTLPAAGTLQLNETDVTANQVITAVDIPKLVFTPETDANGTGYANFNFTVNDGTEDSVAAHTITINVTAENDAPTAADKTITIGEDNNHTFAETDFSFNDIEDGDTLASITITTLPAAGTLQLNETDVTANQVITAVDIPKLVFTPETDANGTGYANFNFT
ncbi:ExeM/NucH family extracellular endonuclease, partial [Dapis sp. BLCC M172]|uniref:ExeM/NucH family extracellular endonuclease n=1 Tax=Dapis sp. BLCC M172 TaxID=2975281 RepID=UPI003CEF6CC6